MDEETAPKVIVRKIEGKMETLERHVPQMLLRGEQVAIIVKINWDRVNTTSYPLEKRTLLVTSRDIMLRRIESSTLYLHRLYIYIYIYFSFFFLSRFVSFSFEQYYRINVSSMFSSMFDLLHDPGAKIWKQSFRIGRKIAMFREHIIKD